MDIKIYTDGACSGNPGPGGYGCILSAVLNNGQVYEVKKAEGFRKTTNNRMELMAAIVGLEALNRPCTVELYSDSKYLVDAFLLGWVESWRAAGWRRGKDTLKNPDLWERLYSLTEIHTVEFIWVKGHAGHPENERCDQLATGKAAEFAE